MATDESVVPATQSETEFMAALKAIRKAVHQLMPGLRYKEFFEGDK